MPKTPQSPSVGANVISAGRTINPLISAARRLNAASGGNGITSQNDVTGFFLQSARRTETPDGESTYATSNNSPWRKTIGRRSDNTRHKRELELYNSSFVSTGAAAGRDSSAPEYYGFPFLVGNSSGCGTMRWGIFDTDNNGVNGHRSIERIVSASDAVEIFQLRGFSSSDVGIMNSSETFQFAVRRYIDTSVPLIGTKLYYLDWVNTSSVYRTIVDNKSIEVSASGKLQFISADNPELNKGVYTSSGLIPYFPGSSASSGSSGTAPIQLRYKELDEMLAVVVDNISIQVGTSAQGRKAQIYDWLSPGTETPASGDYFLFQSATNPSRIMRYATPEDIVDIVCDNLSVEVSAGELQIFAWNSALSENPSATSLFLYNDGGGVAKYSTVASMATAMVDDLSVELSPTNKIQLYDWDTLSGSGTIPNLTLDDNDAIPIKQWSTSGAQYVTTLKYCTLQDIKGSIPSTSNLFWRKGDDGGTSTTCYSKQIWNDLATKARVFDLDGYRLIRAGDTSGTSTDYSVDWSGGKLNLKTWAASTWTLGHNLTIATDATNRKITIGDQASNIADIELNAQVYVYDGLTVRYDAPDGGLYLTDGVTTNRLLTLTQTGWALPTGPSSKATYSTSTVTLEQLAQTVKALIELNFEHNLSST